MPITHILQSNVAKKLTKYTDIKTEVKRVWNINTVTILIKYLKSMRMCEYIHLWKKDQVVSFRTAIGI